MKSKGFTLIELLVAMGLAALFLPALVFVFSFSLDSASQGENYTHAYTLAQENMEAIYYLKESGGTEWEWTNMSPRNTESDEYYQPYKTDETWNLGLTTSTPQQKNGYTVTVKILPVSRNTVTWDIADSGEVDINTREIIVNVSWKEKGEPTEIELVTYVSRH